jgi:hypothetical protein
MAMALLAGLLVSRESLATVSYEGGSYDGYGTSTSAESPLSPVDMVFFAVTGQDGRCLVEWETASEIDFLGFNLQRSMYEDSGYAQVNDSLIHGHGNPVDTAFYSCTDPSVTNGLTYWYRLETIDRSAKSSFLAPDSATPLLTGISDSRLPISNYQLEIHPNPFSHNTVVEFRVRCVETPYMVSLQIHDLSGRVVKSFPFNHLTIQPFNQVLWDGRTNNGKRAREGIYFINLRVGDMKRTSKLVLLR